MIEIKHVKDDPKGYFSASVNGKTAGSLTYTTAGETRIIIDHTEVDKKFLKQGIGKKLVMNVVEYAKLNNLKIIPLCSFAKSVFEKNESIRDVL